MTRRQALTKKWQIKVHLHQKSHEIQILESSKTSQWLKSILWERCGKSSSCTAKSSPNQNRRIKLNLRNYSERGSDKDVANLNSFRPIRPSTLASGIKLNLSDDSDTVSEKDMANQSSFTPKISSTPNSRIKLNLRNDFDTLCDKDMANQISFAPRGSSTWSSRFNPNDSCGSTWSDIILESCEINI